MACSTSTTSTVSSPTTPGTGSASQSSTVPATTSARVGADCGMIPANGKGSAHSMQKQEALSAAASNPQLSVFISAVRAAGLARTLNTKHAYTLVVPANSAFSALPATDIKKLHNTGDLSMILKYHVVGTKVTPAQIAHGIKPASVEGKALTFAKMGSVYEVNGATVLCGNIQTANATIYIINKVLMPPS